MIAGLRQLRLDLEIKCCDLDSILRPQAGNKSRNSSLHEEPFVLCAPTAVEQQQDVVRGGYGQEVNDYLPNSIFIYAEGIGRQVVDRPAACIPDGHIHGNKWHIYL